MFERFSVDVTPNWRGLRSCILREGTPDRVYFIELFLDPEVQDAVCERFHLLEGLSPETPFFALEKQIRVQSFLSYDYVRCSLDPQEWPLHRHKTNDTADMTRAAGRAFVDMQRGPIASWDEFNAYPWPDAETAGTTLLDWYSERLPENLCIMGSGGFAHFAEHLVWLMGYETFCMALFEQRDLVEAIARRLEAYYDIFLERLLAYDRVKIAWGSDDMGFRMGTLFAPDDMRALVLRGHKRMAEMCHAAGRPYLLHSCGKLDDIMPDLMDDVKIDAKHSFEDAIEPVTEAHRKYGERIALLGGLDVDFLCRATEAEIRKRVRDTLEQCHPGGGYCLGTGNSVTNYIPLDNYLVMLDEGRRFMA